MFKENTYENSAEKGGQFRYTSKDEITSGAKTITYCRHFDKLAIISGDNADISPGVLAATLEEKRIEYEAENKPRLRLPVKRKLTVGEPPVPLHDQSESPTTPLPSFSTFAQPNSVSGGSNNTPWYPAESALPACSQSQAGQQTMSALQLSLSTPLKGTPIYQPSAMPQQSPYQYTTQVLKTETMPEINNNKVTIKSEKVDTGYQNQTNVNQSAQWNTFTTVGNALPRGQGHQTQNDLERLRLDIEMKRLEVERNKIEMEERQRREDRDHQYRMMQLLLFGLGQQGGNAQCIEVAHSTDLSRALESGLVPGGQQTVNEKGLSFSEI